MGAAPSAPTDTQAAELKDNLAASIDRAAMAIASADACLLCIGAALSAPVAQTHGDQAAHIRSRENCGGEDQAGYANMWASFLNTCRDAPLAEGYGKLAEWYTHLRAKGLPVFALTSNIDGHARRIIRSEDLLECDGSIEKWQCAKCTARGAVPTEFRFRVDCQSQLVSS